MKKTINHFIALLIFACLFACGSDDPIQNSGNDSNPTGANPDPAPLEYNLGAEITTTISGVVFSKKKQPLQGVLIEINGYNTTTDTTGAFRFSNIQTPSKRTVIKYSKEGFYYGIHTVVPKTNAPTKVLLILEQSLGAEPIDNNISFIAGSGGSVKFPTDAFVDSDGLLLEGTDVKFRTIRTDDPLLPIMVPGTDLKGIDSNNNEVFLYSYGMMQVELPEGVSIAAGKEVELSFYNAEGSTEPQIPMWYLDEATGIWVEEGMATLDGDFYKGNVKHFTYWNVDGPEDEAARICMTIECGGVPMEGISVWGDQTSGTSDNSGDVCVEVRPGQAQNLIAFSDQFGELEATILEVPALSAGETYNLGTGNLDGYGILTGKAIGCDGQAKNTNIRLRTDSGTTFFANPDPETGLFSIAIPADENVYIFSILINKTLGPFTVSNCGTVDFGIIDECDSDIDPDNYSITFTSSEIPELNGFILSRASSDKSDYYICNEFTEMSFNETPLQYANLVQAFFTYEDGIIDTKKESFFPCIEEGIFIYMIDNDEWDVSDPILEELGINVLKFHSISGSIELENTADQWVNGSFNAEFFITAFGSEIHEKTIHAEGTFSFYKKR